MSCDESEDSFVIVILTISEDMSFTHLADISITPIYFPPPGFVASSLIDFIACGVEKEYGSEIDVAFQLVPFQYLSILPLDGGAAYVVVIAAPDTGVTVILYCVGRE